jgi:ATP-dependent protease ClpP protease subunit
MREITNDILVRRTGVPLSGFQKDVERDYMIAEQAKEYGIVDQIIEKNV